MARRGCLIGVGGVLFSLLLCVGLVWFVALPRFHDAVEREVTTLLSTEVAGTLDRQIPDGGGLQTGEYRLSLPDLQRQLGAGSDDLQLEGIRVRGEGNALVLEFSVTNASARYRFIPTVTPDGRLLLTDMEGEGGIVEQLLAPEALGNAVEASVNTYLSANGLVLQDVRVEGDELVLIVDRA